MFVLSYNKHDIILCKEIDNMQVVVNTVYMCVCVCVRHMFITAPQKNTQQGELPQDVQEIHFHLRVEKYVVVVVADEVHVLDSVCDRVGVDTQHQQRAEDPKLPC